MQALVVNASLFGKHPSSSEYLFLGYNSNFMSSVKSWVERGYEALLQNKKTNSSKNIHHFCFINPKSDAFICGSVKMSKDNQKRDYPLTVAIEVSSLFTFDTTQQIMEYAKQINKKILKIFQKELTLLELKKELANLSQHNEFEKKENDFISAIFMNEDFSEVELFSRPLEISDFTKVMR